MLRKKIISYRINMNSFIILVGGLVPASFPNFKLAWKTATLFALVTARYCLNVSLLCSANQHLFLQCNAAIFTLRIWW